MLPMFGSPFILTVLEETEQHPLEDYTMPYPAPRLFRPSRPHAPLALLSVLRADHRRAGGGRRTRSGEREGQQLQEDGV